MESSNKLNSHDSLSRGVHIRRLARTSFGVLKVAVHLRSLGYLRQEVDHKNTLQRNVVQSEFIL